MSNTLFKRFALLGAVSAFVLAGVGTAVAGTKDIDTSKDGASSIHLTKYYKNDHNGKTPGTGEATNAPVNSTPVKGVTFKLDKVGSINGTDVSKLDYTKTESWYKLTTLISGGNPIGTVNMDINFSPQTKATDAKGELAFSDLKFGVYKITELDAPVSVTGKADPFYIILPFAKNNGEGWLYDVYVFPKNVVKASADEIKKEVIDENFHVSGDEIIYKIKTGISAPGGLPPEKYVITDIFSSNGNRLKFEKTDNDVSVALESGGDPFVQGVKNPSPPTTVAGDYYIEESCPTTSLTPVDDFHMCFQVVFTEEGRKKIQKAFFASPVDSVVTTLKKKLKFTLDESNKNSGKNLYNNAYLVPDGNSKWNSVNYGLGNQSGVQTNLTHITIKKRSQTETYYAGNSSYEKKYLEGAQFNIYATLAEAKKKDPAKALKTQWFCNTKETATKGTYKDTRCEVGPIRSSGRVNNVQVSDRKPYHYYLVETVAPESYQLLTEPVELDAYDDDYNYIDVYNYKSNAGLLLTKTGASGPVLFAIIGLAILTLASVAFAVKRRSSNG